MPTYWTDFILPPALASTQDLATWMGSDITNATQLIRAATSLVLEATNQAYYDVDPLTGLATDAQIKQAMNDATCIQAAAWSTLGIDPNLGGVAEAGVEQSIKIGTAAITYGDGAMVASAQFDANTGLVPEAMRKLRLNNLLVPQAWAFG